MGSHIRVFLYSLMIVSLALVSAISVIPARADDGAPPPPASPSAPSSASVHTPVDLSGVPAGTDVVVVNRSGHKVALATQEAAHIVAAGDPIWCPTGAAPNPTFGGCTATYGNLSDLIAAFTGNIISDPAANGVIWIMGFTTNGGFADTSSSAILVDATGGTLGSWGTFTLTVNGGWTGTTAGTIDHNDQTQLNVPLSIVNWGTDVTVNDMLITGLIGASTTGLTVSTSKKITLTNMAVDSNDGAGAVLDNTSGSSDVTLTGSEFNENAAGTGLQILSKGAITLNDVTADTNGVGGASLDNSTALLAKTVTLTSGPLDFSSNTGGDGLDITSKGTISLMNITASGNTSGEGAHLENILGTTAAGVIISGTNTFSTNLTRGLDVTTNGAITASNLIADTNGGRGVWLDNCQAFNNGNICLTATVMPVTLTGTNQFNSNNGGLRIITNGAITVGNITANNNVNSGAWFTNDTSTVGSGVTMTGPNFMNTNGGGLFVNSKGVITLSGLTADSNTAGGASLDNSLATSAKSVILSGGLIEFNNNTGADGLDVISKGTITLANVSASGNTGGNGAHLENILGTTAAGVILTGTNTFSNNLTRGLDVTTNGAITANNLTADSNGARGAWLTNCQEVSGICTTTTVMPVTLTGISHFNSNSGGLRISSNGVVTTGGIVASNNTFGSGVWISNDSSPVHAGVNMTAINLLNSDNGGGLFVTSRGAISVSNLNASSSAAGPGASLDNCLLSGPNCTVTTATAVTLTGINFFNNNFNDGLDVYSFGSITASNLNASGNGTSAVTGTGVWLENDYLNTGLVRSKGTVTLTGMNIFTKNFQDGLTVKSFGLIKASNLNAVSNTGEGANLDNSGALTAQPVTLTNSNIFMSNGLNGLNLKSNGAVTLSSITASGNLAGDGVLIHNDNTGFSSPVTLGGSDLFNNNNSSGLEVVSFGVITLNTLTLTANKNVTGFGVALDNSLAPTPKAVIVKGSSSFDGNLGQGLSVDSKGAITAGNLTSTNSTFSGVTLVNYYPGAVGGVTLTGTNVFENNGRRGLGITSFGAITISNVTANFNDTSSTSGVYGIELDNSNATGAQKVTITGTNVANNNFFGGIRVLSNGTITANNLTALGNLNDAGAFLNNSTGLPSAGVTLTGANFFNSNATYGLDITTHGKVVLTRVTANSNNLDGLFATTPLTLSLTCGSFLHNGQYGIDLNTGGTATITGAVLYDNTSGDTVNQVGAGSVSTPPLCALP